MTQRSDNEISCAWKPKCEKIWPLLPRTPLEFILTKCLSMPRGSHHIWACARPKQTRWTRHRIWTSIRAGVHLAFCFRRAHLSTPTKTTSPISDGAIIIEKSKLVTLAFYNLRGEHQQKHHNHSHKMMGEKKAKFTTSTTVSSSYHHLSASLLAFLDVPYYYLNPNNVSWFWFQFFRSRSNATEKTKESKTRNENNDTR